MSNLLPYGHVCFLALAFLHWDGSKHTPLLSPACILQTQKYADEATLESTSVTLSGPPDTEAWSVASDGRPGVAPPLE